MPKSDAYLDVFPEYSMGVPLEGMNKRYIEENAEGLNGDFIGKILEATSQKKSAVVFTVFLKEDNVIHNAAILAEKGKILAIYRKIHLFDAFGHQESTLFSSGENLAIADLKGFRIGLAVCFDLRFPELFRAMAYKGVNLFIVPSAWYKGKYKVEQWRALIAARAHENVSYLVAADQTKTFFAGHSTVASPFGYMVKELKNEEKSFCVKLSPGEIKNARELMPIIDLSKPYLYDKFYDQK
jgi:predicted amidohydrolase